MERFFAHTDTLIWEVDKAIDLENFLKEKYFSRNLTIDAYRHGLLSVKNQKVKKNIKLFKGDKVIYQIPKEKNSYTFDRTPLNIVDEDEYFLIINKPAYLTMTEAEYEKSCLANQIAYDFYQKGISAKIRFINRLDRDTSGIVVVAKNAYAQAYVMKQMELDAVEKKYISIVEGNIPKNGVIEIPLERIKGEVKSKFSDNGKIARTEYKRISYYDGLSLVELSLLTGRTHQLRIHLASIGHCIVGDKLYGSTIDFPRQALHAISYSFVHPKGLKRSYKAAIPDDIKKLLNEKHLLLEEERNVCFL